MRRIIRYLFGFLILALGGVLGWQAGMASAWTWLALVGLAVLAPIVAFGPEIFGALTIDGPGGWGVDFDGSEEADDCE